MRDLLPSPSWVPVVSSNVDAVRHVLGEWLDVRFHGGAVYRYYGVPVYVYREMLAAASKGRFVHQHLKGVYQYARL